MSDYEVTLVNDNSMFHPVFFSGTELIISV